jgi:hypothetical protein
MLFAVTSAKADTVTGSVYENTGGVNANLTPGSNGTLAGTFTAPSPINFNSNGTTDYTIASFIGTGGGTYTGTHGGDTLDNTLFYINGMVTVTNGEQFTTTQDDGLILVIDGVSVINQPGPHSPTQYTSTYTGPSGTYAFQLGYAEIDGAPGVLQISLPLAATPEPSSFMLLGSGLLGAAGMLRRRMKS